MLQIEEQKSDQSKLIYVISYEFKNCTAEH